MSDLERRSWLSRRHFCAGFAAAGCALITAPGRAALAALPARKLSFYSLHTQESLSTVFWQDGRYLADGLREIDYMLRDFRTGEVRAIDPELLDLLHRPAAGHGLRWADQRDLRLSLPGDQRDAGGAQQAAWPRTAITCAAWRSTSACRDGRCATVRDAAWALALGGVGYYPESDFVHVDTGPVRAW